MIPAKRLLQLLVLLIIPFLLGNSNRVTSENEYFYLNNYTTYSPGTEVQVGIYGNTSGRFNFKLLRIDDPIAFFSEIDRNNARYNFDIWGSEKSLLLKHTSLVKEWNERISGKRDYYNSQIKLGKIDEPGIYILQALQDDMVAYCGVVVTDLSIVYKNTGKQVVGFLANAQSGEFLNSARFDIYSKGKILSTKNADADGLIEFNLNELKEINSNDVQLFAHYGNEVILSDPYFYFRQGNTNQYMAYFYTNQPVYRPGQEVFFKGIFRNREGNELKNVSDVEVQVEIKSPRNKSVYKSALTLNDLGTIYESFLLDEEADLGVYSIYATANGQSFYGSFSVEEYKKPEYFVTVKTGKEQYTAGDTIKGTVTADYYFVSPVKEATVQVNIHKRVYWRPWWYWSEYSWFYRGFQSGKSAYWYGQTEQVHYVTGELNDKGEYEFEYELNEKFEGDYVYVVSAEVTDASRRAISGSKQVYATRGEFTLSTSPTKYFFNLNEEVKLRINASDFSDKPVETDFRVIINYPNNKDKFLNDTLFASTDENGKALLNFKPDRNAEGYFNYTVIAFDKREREITTSGSFYVGDINRYFYGRTSSGVEIVTDKDTYEKGDSLIAYVFLPFENTELLLTLESSEIISYKKLHPDKNVFVIREKLTDKFAPSFNISVTFLRERTLYANNKLVGVLAKDKMLDISINPKKDIYKPGEDAEYIVSVKDYKGNPVRNTELSFGVVDESIYAIKEDETPQIQNFFYAPQYNYIATYNSLQYGYFSGSSRKATYLDKNYFSGKQDSDEKRFGSVSGKLIFENDAYSPENFYLILSGEKNYYTIQIDSTGKFDLDKILFGEYDVFIASSNNKTAFIKKIKIDGNEKIELEVDELTSSNQFLGEGGELLESEVSAPNMVADEMSLMNGRMEKSKKEDKDAYVKADLRTKFVDAAFWRANLRTDSEGNASVSFKLPDNLTTWRATVRGITSTSEVGQKVDKIIVRKDLLVRTETPRFFREGDVVTISTMVHNYLSTEKKTKITFDYKNLYLVSSKISSKGFENTKGKKETNFYEVNIPADSELRIDWLVKVSIPIGEVKVKAEALTNEESDAMEVTLPVIPNGVKMINSLAEVYTGDDLNETLTFNIPDDANLQTAKLSFSISPSLAASLLKALDELVDYPYGCVEQTMSRFLPAIIVSNTFKEINAPLKSETIEKLPDVIDKGLKRLYELQHSDGGWGWWTNDKTHPYMTAYVIYGLALAKDAGYKIDENVLYSGLNNLKGQIESASDIDETTLSYMVFSYTTAMKNQTYDKEFFVDLADVMMKKDLQTYPLSLLTLSFINMNEKDKAGKVAEKLKSKVNEEKTFAFWGGDGWHYRWQNDNVQSTAFAVKALLKAEGNSDLVVKAVRWLLRKRQGYSWRSTQETAVVVFALTDYLKATDELNPDYSAQVLVNGKAVKSYAFNSSDVFNESESIVLDGNDLINGTNKITIVKTGKGKIYLTGFNQFYTLEYDEDSDGFKISREYFLISQKEKDGRVIYEKKKFDGNIKSGELLLVKTNVKTKLKDSEYFILEDMLPSGFEVVKDEQNYTIEEEPNYQHYDYYYGRMPWRWFYADKEYRDEKVAFFATYVQQEMNFSYILRAQVPGEFAVMPSQGYLMYYPEVAGYSDHLEMNVKDQF